MWLNLGEKIFIRASHVALVGEDRDRTRIVYAELRKNWRAENPNDWGAAVVNIADTATDIFLAAKCLIYVAGGDPVAGRWPDTVPLEMRRFVDTCLFAAPRMRPQNAWDLHEEFDELLVRLFGPPKYHRLVMT